MTDRELMQQALEALELLARYENPATKIQVRKPKDGGPIVTMYPHKVATEAAAPLRERLAQPEQEPVAWRWKERVNGDFDSWVISVSEPPPYAIENQPLYTSTPERKPLTKEEIADLWGGQLFHITDLKLATDFVRDVERAHGIGGQT